MAGVDLRTLAAILGHRTMQMVMRYTHLLDDHKQAAIDKIDGLGMGKRKKGSRIQGLKDSSVRKKKKEGRAAGRRIHRPDRVTADGEGRTAG
jgi:hypothetical protein